MVGEGCVCLFSAAMSLWLRYGSRYGLRHGVGMFRGTSVAGNVRAWMSSKVDGVGGGGLDGNGGGGREKKSGEELMKRMIDASLKEEMKVEDVTGEVDGSETQKGVGDGMGSSDVGKDEAGKLAEGTRSEPSLGVEEVEGVVMKSVDLSENNPYGEKEEGAETEEQRANGLPNVVAADTSTRDPLYRYYDYRMQTVDSRRWYGCIRYTIRRSLDLTLDRCRCSFLSELITRVNHTGT